MSLITYDAFFTVYSALGAPLSFTLLISFAKLYGRLVQSEKAVLYYTSTLLFFLNLFAIECVLFIVRANPCK